MTHIIPAILATTEEQFKEDVQKVNDCELLQGGWVQIDLTDNKFVQNQTVGSTEIEKYPLNLQKEAHLMVTNPLTFLSDLKRLGFERLIVHQEIENLPQVIQSIKDQGLAVGIALNPETAVSSIEPLLTTIDIVQIMSIKPGFQGQDFLPESLEKIAEVSRLRSENNVSFLISVDGGLNVENIKEVVQAGADNLVIGSALLKGDIDENLELIWEALN